MKDLFLELIVLYGCALLYYTPLLFVVWGDIIGLLVKIFRLKKNIQGYEVQKMFLKSDEYIQHKKKWMRKFLYPLLACGLSWGFLRIVGTNESLSMSVSHFVLIVCYGIIAGKEAKARKVIRQAFLDRVIVYPSVDVRFEFNHQRQTLVKDGYRADHRFDEQHIAIGVHHYQGVSQVSPGESAFGTISFVAPEYYPHSLYEGKEILIQEGEKIIGSATVIKINSPILKKKIARMRYEKVYENYSSNSNNGFTSNGIAHIRNTLGVF